MSALARSKTRARASAGRASLVAALVLLLLALGAAGLLLGGRGGRAPRAALERERGGAALAAPELAALERSAQAPESSSRAEPERASAPAPAVQQRPERALSGRVLDARGAPLAGARVLAGLEHLLAGLALEPRPEELAVLRATETDADGRFELAPEPRGSAAARGLRLRVHKPGYVPHERDLPAERALGEIVLEDAVVLEGRVSDRAGAPVSGAELWLVAPAPSPASRLGPAQGVRAAESDELGRFRLDQLRHGPWALRVISPRHPTLVARGETHASGERVLALELVLEEGAEISGRVLGAAPDEDVWVRASPSARPEPAFRALDRATGSAPAGEALAFEPPRSAPCTAEGSFVLAGLRPGTSYRLEPVRGPGEFLAPALGPALEALAGARELELVLARESAFVLRALDSESGEPVTSFELRAGASHLVPLLDGAGRPRREFPGGRARFPLAPPAAGTRLSVRLEAPGYRPLVLEGLVLPARGELDLGDLRLERAR